MLSHFSLFVAQILLLGKPISPLYFPSIMRPRMTPVFIVSLVIMFFLHTFTVFHTTARFRSLLRFCFTQAMRNVRPFNLPFSARAAV